MSNGSISIGELIVLDAPSGPQSAATIAYVDAHGGGLSGELCVAGPDANAGGFNTSAFGFQSFAIGFQSIAGADKSFATGDSFANGPYSTAEGDSYTGNYPQTFSISGSTVTISGINVANQFASGHKISLYGLTGGTNNTLNNLITTIASTPAFSTDTTFDIDATLDDRTGGTCVDIGFAHFSHAEGSSNALGGYSHAEGNSNALADYSHAEGFGCTTLDEDAHAEGHDSRATGPASHAEGNSTADGGWSHSEGHSTLASGNRAHAEGDSTQAIGPYSHAQNNATTAYAANSHTEGHNSRTGNLPDTFTISGSTLTIAGDVTSKFTNGANITLYALTGGTNNELFVQETNITSSPAFSGGNTTFDIADVPDDRTGGSCVNTDAGEGAHAEGENTIASGLNSHAEGNTTTASGIYSHAEGFNNTASGTNSHSEGGNTNASTDCAHTEGNGTFANGVNAHAEGNNTTASGLSSHAQGSYSTARQTGQHSLASGKFATIGDAQTTELILRNSTTDATPTALFVDGTAEQLLIANQTTYGYSAKIIARQTGGTSTCAYFEKNGFITRDADVSTTRILTGSSNVTADTNALAWDITVTADNTNGALIFTVTGAASTTIQWVAQIRLVETFE